jgi:hypothetical protein
VKRCCEPNEGVFAGSVLVHTPTVPSTVSHGRCRKRHLIYLSILPPIYQHVYEPPNVMKMEGYSTSIKEHAPASSLPAPIRSEKVQHLRPSAKVPLSEPLKIQPM